MKKILINIMIIILFIIYAPLLMILINPVVWVILFGDEDSLDKAAEKFLFPFTYLSKQRHKLKQQ